MLENEDIVYVANDWRGENKTSAHHIAEGLSRGNRLLYVEAAGQRAPRASGRDVKKIFRKLARACADPAPVAENVRVYSPLILPFHKYGVVRALNRRLLRWFVRRACRKVGFREPILWIVLPHYSSIVADLPWKAVVYYCVDEYSSQPNVEVARIQEMEREVLKRADVVFTVSQTLLDNKIRLNANAYLSPHGVDFAHFVRSRDRDLEVPADMSSIPRPIAGFFGLIEEWIDLNLVRYAAEQLPGVSFVMLGSVAQPVDDLKTMDNVYFLGHRRYEQLPAYMKAFDVGILPYKLNEQVINSNPKKLREYLAGGKPVVSVRVREVERYAPMVRISDTREEFVEAIEEAIRTDDEGQARERIEAMRAESWESKVEFVGETVRNRISEVVS